MVRHALLSLQFFLQASRPHECRICREGETISRLGDERLDVEQKDLGVARLANKLN